MEYSYLAFDWLRLGTCENIFFLLGFLIVKLFAGKISSEIGSRTELMNDH